MKSFGYTLEELRSAGHGDCSLSECSKINSNINCKSNCLISDGHG